MSKEKEPSPPLGTEERKQWAIERAKKNWQEIIEAGESDCDSSGVIAGSSTSVTASDAELFPDEAEEYTPAERKPRLVRDAKTKKN